MESHSCLGLPKCSSPYPQDCSPMCGKSTHISVWMTSGNSFKLKEGRSRLKNRKIFFTVKVLRHWHTLHREVVDALYLVKVPHNPNYSMILWLNGSMTLWLRVFSNQKSSVTLWCFIISCGASGLCLCCTPWALFDDGTGQTHGVTTVTPFSLHKCCFRSVPNVLLWWTSLFVLMCLVHGCNSERE